MTFTTTRAEIAIALSTVAGVTGYQFQPTVFKAGDGWPLLDTAAREGRAFSATWRVQVCLGNVEKDASQLSDKILPELVDALDQTGAYVTQISPVLLATEGGNLFALELSCNRLHLPGEP